MTVASTVSRVDYTGNGSTATYGYTFRITDEDDLTVTVRDTSDVETTLVKTTDYTVTGVGAQAGGNVVLVNASQSWLTSGFLTSGYIITIRRVVDLTQETDIRNQGSFFPETHEDVFDKLTFADQQQQDQLDRSFTLPETIDPADIDTTLPFPSAGLGIGWNATEDGLTNLTSFGSVPITAFGESLVDDANATTARTTLDAAQLTSSRTQDTAPAVNDFIGTVDTSASSAEKKALLATVVASALGVDGITNLGLAASVGSNALTVSLKGADGNNASSTNPVYILFRNVTSATGTPVLRSVTGALSVVVSSGSTLGTTSAVAENLYVYAIDNAGTVELAISRALFNEGTVVSTTAEGGAGAADSGTVMYSTTARSNVPFRLIGRIIATEVTPGTWATAPSEIALPPFSQSAMSPTQQRFTSGSGTYTTPTGRVPLYLRVRMCGGGGGGAGSGTGSSGGAGGAGGNTTFGTSLLTANGGSGAPNGNTGATAGGTATISSPAVGTALTGGVGGGQTNFAAGVAMAVAGGYGGVNPFGGNGGSSAAGSAAGATNTGAGGGGGAFNSNSAGSGNSGCGGGAGGFIDAIILNPSTTYSYAVGAAGTAGTAGTSGNAGTAGGSGYIEVTEYYQ